jgi:hypothetical protein
MLTWTQQTPFGAYPSPTYDNCAVGLDGKLYVFGVRHVSARKFCRLRASLPVHVRVVSSLLAM